MTQTTILQVSVIVFFVLFIYYFANFSKERDFDFVDVFWLTLLASFVTFIAIMGFILAIIFIVMGTKYYLKTFNLHLSYLESGIVTILFILLIIAIYKFQKWRNK